jgi:hypothetical protein
VGGGCGCGCGGGQHLGGGKAVDTIHTLKKPTSSNLNAVVAFFFFEMLSVECETGDAAGDDEEFKESAVKYILWKKGLLPRVLSLPIRLPIRLRRLSGFSVW